LYNLSSCRERWRRRVIDKHTTHVHLWSRQAHSLVDCSVNWKCF